MSTPIRFFNQTLPEAFHLPEKDGREYLPHAYRTVNPATRTATAEISPRNVFIEVTNHCNLLCETCPRTFVTYEELQTLSWENFLAIVDQFPDMERAVLHGIGEPLLNKDLPRMIAHLKARDVFVLFNTNAVLLDEAWARKLIASELDELRISIDGADPKTYALIRGAPLLHKVVQNLKQFVEIQKALHVNHPSPSLWMTGMKENIAELPEVIHLAAYMGVREVYLQRMVYYADDTPDTPDMRGDGHGLFANFDAEINHIVAESEILAQSLGVKLWASGATTAPNSLSTKQEPRPWSACLRPWTTAYITANGNALPCCISPFATSDYDSLKLGNTLEKPFAKIWNAPAYQQWRQRLLSDSPHSACAGCGVHWSL